MCLKGYKAGNDRQLRTTTFDDDEAKVDQLEMWTDSLDSKLPTLTNFILSSGGSSGFLHLSRTVCRRSERSVEKVFSQGLCDPSVPRYLNRLGDYLFVAARHAAYHVVSLDTIYSFLLE